MAKDDSDEIDARRELNRRPLHDGDYLFVRETGERIPLDDLDDDSSDDTWEIAKRIMALPDNVKQQVLQMIDIEL